MDTLVILGHRQAQNELMANHFRKVLSSFEGEIKTGAQVVEFPGFSGETLFLVDTSCRDFEGIEADAIRHLGMLGTGSSLALFNVVNIEGIEKNLIGMGVRGVFFESDSLLTIQRGVKALMGGEVWASRKTLSCLLGKTILHSQQEHNNATHLSAREREVLLMISGGKSDSEIADHLCISSNTVKTHLYRVFKKLQVNNRLQAALWATKNLVP